MSGGCAIDRMFYVPKCKQSFRLFSCIKIRHGYVWQKRKFGYISTACILYVSGKMRVCVCLNVILLVNGKFDL